MADVNAAVGGIIQPQGITNTGAAINLAVASFTAANGDRPGVENIIMVLTDGLSNFG